MFFFLTTIRNIGIIVLMSNLLEDKLYEGKRVKFNVTLDMDIRERMRFKQFCQKHNLKMGGWVRDLILTELACQESQESQE